MSAAADMRSQVCDKGVLQPPLLPSCVAVRRRDEAFSNTAKDFTESQEHIQNHTEDSGGDSICASGGGTDRGRLHSPDSGGNC